MLNILRLIKFKNSIIYIFKLYIVFKKLNFKNYYEKKIKTIINNKI